MRNIYITYLASIFFLMATQPFSHAQSSIKVGSGIYQFSNYDPELVRGISLTLAHQINDKKIKRVGYRGGLTYDYFASKTGRGNSSVFSSGALANGSGLAISFDIVTTVIDKEKFNWQIINGTFMNHYHVRFQNFIETFDEAAGYLNRHITPGYEWIDAAIGYQLSTTFLFKTSSKSWITLSPFEWQIAPDGYARLTASTGITF
jgi:hypothetical protein